MPPSQLAKTIGQELARSQAEQTAENITVGLLFQPLRIVATHRSFTAEIAPPIEIPAKDLLPKGSINDTVNALTLYRAKNYHIASARAVQGNIAHHAAVAWQTHADQTPLYRLRALTRNIFWAREYTELEKVAINHDEHNKTYTTMDLATCVYWLEWAWNHWGDQKETTPCSN